MTTEETEINIMYFDIKCLLHNIERTKHLNLTTVDALAKELSARLEEVEGRRRNNERD